MITVNELFSGIGAQRAALERLGIPYKIVGISEIDKFAIQSYISMYGETKNYGDISKVETLDYADLWTYSFPCTDISVAGKQAGMIKGETRSGLLYEIQRLLEVSKRNGELPKYLMLENVKNLVGERFLPQFVKWVAYLKGLGYNTYYKVLNSKNYGVPQSRDRVFAISVRKDIDKRTFSFTEGFDSGLRLKDMLDDKADDCYYVSSKRMKLTSAIGNGSQIPMVKGNVVNQVANCLPTKTRDNPNQGRIYDTDYVSPALNCMSGGHRQPMIITPNECIQSGDLQKYGNAQMNRVYSPNGVSPTVMTKTGGGREVKIMDIDNPPFKVRKLTPKECWRLMGFSDEQFYAAKTGSVKVAKALLRKYPHKGYRQTTEAERLSKMSNTQLYKQAGNSIVVDTLYHIFDSLFIKDTKEDGYG